MKTLSIKAFTIFIILFVAGCELETEQYDQINPEIFLKNSDEVTTVVNAAAYSPFNFNAKWSSLFSAASGSYLMVSELMTDYGECFWRNRAPVMYGYWTIQTGYVRAPFNWYSGISKMTLTMDRIKDVEMDEDLKSRYMGELKCGRGWLALLMYNLYGPIPVADLETLQNPLEEKILPRLSDAEMRNFIETNLKEAAQVLPYKYDDNDYGRYTKGMANTLLMKFYMKIGDFTSAEAIGRELLKPEYGYELASSYEYLFTLEGERNNEIIHAIVCVPGGQYHMWHAHVLPNDYPASEAISPVKWGGYKLAWDFVETYEEGDERLNTISMEYEKSNGDLVTRNTPNSNIYYGAVPVKYSLKGTIGRESEIDFIIYRYADVLTLLSEAIVRNAGSVTQEAIDLLNEVRTRAGITNYQLSDIPSVENFLDKVLLERGHELYFEGSRREDLIRHGKFVESIREKAQRTGEVTTINENMKLLPLPQWLIDEGQGKIEQNPGY